MINVIIHKNNGLDGNEPYLLCKADIDGEQLEQYWEEFKDSEPDFNDQFVDFLKQKKIDVEYDIDSSWVLV